MWILTIRSPTGEPRQYTLKAGNNTIGRMSGNDIVILDPSASRYHAELILDEKRRTVTVNDLGSTNGTFVNRERLTSPKTLAVNDVIRIGQHLMELSLTDTLDQSQATQPPRDSRLLTRELILESLDHHAVLLTEVASRLNTMLDLETALNEVSRLIKTSMGADRCEVILAEQFAGLKEMGFARSIAQQAIEQRSAVIFQDAQSDPTVGKSAVLLHIHAAMCVPVMGGDQILALIYVFKNRPRARPFDQRDMQLAVAIGHQASLTIQRMQLLERVRQEELISSLLQRFLSPQEADFVLKGYIETGQLPELEEHNLTILAADICQSTKMAERLGSRRFSKILSNYYQEMTNIVFSYGGMLNKYLGDGLMAIFGMPHQSDTPELRAVQTALDILDRLDYISQSTAELLEIGIGINTGQTMAGYLGSLEYVEFTVIGYPVNLAWGLEANARPNRILIGHPTYQAVSGKFPIKDIGVLSIKPGSEPIHAYEVMRREH
jgi:adenylate cyclase